MDNPIIFYYTVAPSPEIHITNIKPHHNNKYKYKYKYTIPPYQKYTYTSQISNIITTSNIQAAKPIDRHQKINKQLK